ncbi:hypothetical protein [Histidinibacterium lentulum]|uniref:Uncharacterized protein n=1 Tax=Histidinibacterium lentulum TaxID=2480588 RepID=A0A3N2QRZ2_9RHOB|nr:hypothetical protein [Histidinibacterium lentulum]ROT97992.1 hypothetical protein EAT49_17100 [Histidinibacterium lentulum]
MRGLCVVALGDPDAALAGEVTAALAARGFEVFGTCSLDRLPDPPFPTGQALVAFNPLLESETTPAAAFASPELARAAHLVSTLPATPRLRITRSEAEAERIARSLLGPEGMAELDAALAAARAGMATDRTVLADLSRFKYRAKVERVAHGGGTAILKTFRPAARDALAREAHFVEHMARLSAVPPRLLARDDRSLLFEDIPDALRRPRILGLRLPLPLPLAHVRTLAEFVRLCCAEGFDAIDLTPRDNVLIDARTGRLRAIDFEFAARREGPVPPERSYVLSGVPRDAPVALPLLNAMDEDPYPSKWRPYTGLPKASFLGDPPWLQRLKRATLHPFWLIGFAAGAALRRRRHGRDRAASLARVAWRPAAGSDAPREAGAERREQS